MLNVLAACGNGMGSSLIIKMKIEKVLKDMGTECEVHHASVSEAKSKASEYDLIIVSHTLVKEFEHIGISKIVGLVNLLSEDEIKNKVSAVLN